MAQKNQITYYFVPGNGLTRDIVFKKLSEFDWYYRAKTKKECNATCCCSAQRLNDEHIITKERANEICKEWYKELKGIK